jgi:OmpA-OmpF porin, OOP family
MLGGLLILCLGVAHAGDKDKDGIPNKTDACKDVSEDLDGFEDTDGCPDTDNDGDGVEDADDKCPDEPEDADGNDDEDGCPDPDDDHDFVPDVDDKCPNEAEDGLGAADGCPEVNFDLLTNQGWMASVGELMDRVFEAAGKQSEGCGPGATSVRAWLDSHDPAVEKAVFEARLTRMPEYLKEQTLRDLLAGKGTSYPSLRTAIGIFCKDSAAWNGVSGELDVVMKDWMPAE